jgi:hypothetical protein
MNIEALTGRIIDAVAEAVLGPEEKPGAKPNAAKAALDLLNAVASVAKANGYDPGKQRLVDFLEDNLKSEPCSGCGLRQSQTGARSRAAPPFDAPRCQVCNRVPRAGVPIPDPPARPTSESRFMTSVPGALALQVADACLSLADDHDCPLCHMRTGGGGGDGGVKHDDDCTVAMFKDAVARAPGSKAAGDLALEIADTCAEMAENDDCPLCQQNENGRHDYDCAVCNFMNAVENDKAKAESEAQPKSAYETRLKLAIEHEDPAECAACAEKPGMPELCGACLHNRDLVCKLSEQLARAAKTETDLFIADARSEKTIETLTKAVAALEKQLENVCSGGEMVIVRGTVGDEVRTSYPNDTWEPIVRVGIDKFYEVASGRRYNPMYFTTRPATGLGADHIRALKWIRDDDNDDCPHPAWLSEVLPRLTDDGLIQSNPMVGLSLTAAGRDMLRKIGGDLRVQVGPTGWLAKYTGRAPSMVSFSLTQDREMALIFDELEPAVDIELELIRQGITASVVRELPTDDGQKPRDQMVYTHAVDKEGFTYRIGDEVYAEASNGGGSFWLPVKGFYAEVGDMVVGNVWSEYTDYVTNRIVKWDRPARSVRARKANAR